jgi:hypothetical protein
MLDAPMTENEVALTDGTEDIALGTFLSRPTLIDSRSWLTTDPTGALGATITPWFTFLNDTRIKKKIDNYAFMRARMHIKVVVNGTPFQYGQLRLAYRPLTAIASAKVRSGTILGQELIPVSQQPGFYIYPQANAGGEMVLPFLTNKSWLDITNGADVNNFGQLAFWVYYPLNVAVAGGSTSVSIRMYAWLTDVSLMGSTTKLTLQSDEYGNGPISRPASAVASLASNLRHIPFIGRFARATEIGASAVSQVASLFGFTNVPVIDNVAPFQPMNAPHLASSQIGTPLQKLTLDPKQELSVDPSPHGIGSIDELSLNYLKTKESFFCTSNWGTSDFVDTCLFSTAITPVICQQESILSLASANVGQRVWHTPLSWLSTMFFGWRGDIIIRMKVVCTKFHKGRLKISYDPIINMGGTNAPENSVYTQIVDIGEQDDIEIRIPYHQPTSWCRMREILTNKWSAGSGGATPILSFDNGSLSVRVLTALTAPSSGQIGLLFYIRGADNFEFANPTDKVKGLTDVPTTYSTPSFFALQADDRTDVITSTINLGPPATVFPERYGLNYGECVSSLRTLIHRAMISDVSSNQTLSSGVAQFWFKNYKRMPYTPGFYTSGGPPTQANNVIAAAGSTSYAFNEMPMLPYVAAPFIGYRGGTNVYVTPSTDAYGFIDDVRVARITDPSLQSAATTYGSIGSVLPTLSTQSAAALFYNVGSVIRNGFSGMATTSNRTNSSLTFNIPDANHLNFSGVAPLTYLTGQVIDGTDTQGARLALLLKNRDVTIQNGQATLSITSAASGGADFHCLYFLCVPTMDYMTAAPVPI